MELIYEMLAGVQKVLCWTQPMTWCCPQAQISIAAFLWKSHSKYQKEHEEKTKYKLTYCTQGWIFVIIRAGCYKPEMIWWCSAVTQLFSRDYKQKRPLALLLFLASARINTDEHVRWHKETKHVRSKICRTGSLPSSTECSCQQFWGQNTPLWALSLCCTAAVSLQVMATHTHSPVLRSGANTKAWFCLLRASCQSVKPQTLPPLPPWCWCCSFSGWCLCLIWS